MRGFRASLKGRGEKEFDAGARCGAGADAGTGADPSQTRTATRTVAYVFRNVHRVRIGKRTITPTQCTFSNTRLGKVTENVR